MVVKAPVMMWAIAVVSDMELWGTAAAWAIKMELIFVVLLLQY